MGELETKVTVLVDNHAEPGLAAEHGLSLWIEADGLRILFDTGKGMALAVNAPQLGVDVGAADHIVLSHGHYDHSGGLIWALERNDRATIHLHPAALRARYSHRESGVHAIGIGGRAVGALRALAPDRVHHVTSPYQLSQRVCLSGPVPRATEYETADGSFSLDPEGLVPDPVEDDLALWITGDEGLTVCLGCAHAGVINTLRHAQQVSGHSRLHTVLGGLHLRSAGDDRVAATTAALTELSPRLVAPCHCTGEAATEALQRALGDAVTPPRAGTVLRCG